MSVRSTAMLAVVCFLLTLPHPAHAETSAERRLTVGTKVAAPFVMRGDDGAWTGVSFDLWRGMADRLGLEFEIRETDIEGLLSGVENGDFDIGVAALTVTPERERKVDFTHPFFTTGLGIAVGTQSNSGWSAVLNGLVSREFVTVLLVLGLVLLLTGVVVWSFERRKNPEQFGGKPAEGVGSGFWWAAVTMTTVGYGDKAPLTTGGRIVALIWMFASLVTISTFTAAIASALTVGSLQGPIQGPEDLGRGRVGSVADTATAGWLTQRNLRFKSYDSIEQALAALEAGQLDAVVYDDPILRYLARTQPRDGLTVLPRVFERQDYAFVLPSGSALRESLNLAMLESLEDPEWKATLATYLGD